MIFNVALSFFTSSESAEVSVAAGKAARVDILEGDQRQERDGEPGDGLEPDRQHQGAGQHVHGVGFHVWSACYTERAAAPQPADDAVAHQHSRRNRPRLQTAQRGEARPLLRPSQHESRQVRGWLRQPWRQSSRLW